VLSLLITGIAYAALQSQAKLTSNTIATATANLLLSTDGTTYSSSLSGFNFDSIVPGGAAVPQSGYSLWLKNGGGTALALKLSVSGTPSNPANADLNKVNVILTPISSGTPQSFTLQSLITSNPTGGTVITVPAQLFPGNTAIFTIKASMDSDAITGSGASLSNIDFAFTGVPQ